MSDDSDQNEPSELRQRLKIEESESIVEESIKESIEESNGKGNEKDSVSESDEKAIYYENENEVEIDENEIENDNEINEVKVKVFRGVKRQNLQLTSNRPSFITRQFNSIKSFFLELIDFIFLFLTTLFNPMADINNQVQEHNQRKMAREGKYFTSKSSKGTNFPGCGPSS